MRVLEARVNRAQFLQRAREQGSRREQEQQQSDLCSHQRPSPGTAHPASAGAGHRQSRLKVGSAGAERRKQPEQHGREDREAQGKRERPSIGGNIQQDATPTTRHHRQEELRGPVCERHSDDTAGGGKQRALRQKLTHDPSARRSQ
jgi:hypothetical protein